MITRKEAEARIAAGGTITFAELTEITSKRGSWSAEESERLLKACPEWVEQDRQREAKRKAAEERFRIEEEPIIRDLAAVGHEVGSVYDLVNTATSYPAAIPVLLDHLPRPYHPRIRQGIARALTVKEARGLAGEVLLRELRRSDEDHDTRWTLANALTVAAERKDAGGIRALLDDPKYGDVHERLGQAIRNLF